MRNRVRARNGFTIVELLVSMALIIFIMAILSQAFVSATKSFRDLKAAGDMAEKLRGVTQLLTNDLAAYHFEGTKRLSDPDFWNNGPPREGFLRIWSGSDYIVVPPGTAAPLNANVDELADLDGLHSFRSVTHTLQYTVKLQGNQRQNFFQGFVPPGAPAFFSGVVPARYQDSGAYTSQWAEVALFLVQQPDTAMGTSGLPPTQLYSLYRRQRLLVPDNSLVAPPVPLAQANSYVELSTSASANPLNLYFNSPRDVTMPVRRFGMDPTQLPGADPTPPLPPVGTPPGTPNNFPVNFPLLAQFNPGPQAQFAAADLLLTDVISFDVQVFVVGNPNFCNLQTLVGLGYTNNNSGFGAGAQAIFDTWSSASDGTYDYSGWAFPNAPSTIPMWKNVNTGLPIQIRAIQIQIRIWDINTQQTRQVTIVQDM